MDDVSTEGVQDFVTQKCNLDRVVQAIREMKWMCIRWRTFLRWCSTEGT